MKREEVLDALRAGEFDGISHTYEPYSGYGEKIAIKRWIEIVSSTYYLPELIAPEGCLTKKRPDKAQREDIRLGWNVAKELGRLDGAMRGHKKSNGAGA